MSEIGEYARTSDGIIGKIEKYSNFEYHIRTSKYDVWKVSKSFIKAHSKNIIDLIEVGDIVNRKKVLRTYKDKEQQYIVLETRNIFSSQYKDILTILTKEQYKQYSYKVVE